MENSITACDIEALGSAARKALAYLQTVGSRPVAPSTSAVRNLAQFDEPLPEAPTDTFCVIDLLDRIGSPGTVATAGGRFFGFVNGAALPVSVAATWIASSWDQNAALRVMSPTAAALEDVALGWVRDRLGLPPESGGAVVTGATMANFTGLAAARHALLERSGWDVENDGMFGAPRLTVVVGEEAHASLLKALGLLGLGRRRVIRVPVDEQGRMRADRMPALDDRTIVCIQAGNVNSGAFDPAAEICRRGRRVGPRGRRVWTVGGGIAEVSPPHRGIRPGRFMGGRWPQVAQRGLRLRNRDCAKCGRHAGSHGDLGGLLHSGRIARAIPLHPGNVPARTGRGVVGLAAIVGAPGPGGINRTDLPACPAIRRGAASGRPRNPERGRDQPGAGIVR